MAEPQNHATSRLRSVYSEIKVQADKDF